MVEKSTMNGIDVLTIESKYLNVAIAPALGGKILSIYNKIIQKEFVWINQQQSLEKKEPGADYDTNFLGGIDELIPNDVPEIIDSIDYPDHGELWTTALKFSYTDETISVGGKLGLSGLYYNKTLSVDPDNCLLNLDYTIKNTATSERHFLWKLHAALQIKAGDKLLTNAKYGQVVDPAYSRFKDTALFDWPLIEKQDASIVPAKSDAIDFFYLFDAPDGEMQLVSNNGKHVFSYRYDKKVFPYQWYFASYGGFFNHYTAILEPCTNMPMSVNEAKEKGQCAVLKAGETLNTKVTIYAGEKI
jgi:hypothetical protein